MIDTFRRAGNIINKEEVLPDVGAGVRPEAVDKTRIPSPLL
jgi:hypothetical protein